MTVPFTTQSLQDALTAKLALNFGTEPGEATDQEMLKACALVLRDVMALRGVQTAKETKKEQKKQVHYLSLEFLMGRSLMKNAYNLGVLPELKEALGNLGFKSGDLFELEPDAGLGNGGLGRLAACYLDSMTTLDIPATGYSICYELGIFKQKIVEGQQVELPDDWKGVGSAWLLPKPDEAQAVHFGGTLREFWHDGHLHIVNENSTTVLAVPCDMVVAGYDTDHVNTLRLWDARSTRPVDMALFSRGEYLKASEDEAMAETIAKVLYPEDNHYEGKSLRLKQQYFFISATVQRVIARFKKKHTDFNELPDKVAFQLNDTHPSMAVAELMRVLVDENDLPWDQAWDITRRVCAYTNHTIMSEALEKWPMELFSRLLPRIYQIVEEINRRFVLELTEKYGNNPDKIRKMAIIADGQIRMAFLAIVGSHSVNGVAALHTEILKKQELHDFYELYPEKFNNKTNGITQRRWLLHANPKLAELITETIGKGWITNLDELKKLVPYAEDAAFRSRFTAIKKENKIALAQYIKETKGIDINPDSIFDIQVKRLHEYKRQLLNILHVIGLYNHLKMNPGLDMIPRTFIFGAKAAAGYHRAKLIIKLINAVADVVNNDPTIHGKIKVVFMENYRVSLAEKMIPAADVSEQISTAGKEASGTGNMKFMLNGALTIGTMDGANVEICEEVGRDNIFIFGMSAAEVQQKTQEGYDPWMVYNMNQEVRMALTSLIDGTFDPDTNLFRELYDALLNGCGGRADEYFVLEDYADYARAQWDIDRAYRDEEKWVRMAILNTAESGKFSSDRTIRQYADEIWQLPSVEIV